MPRTIRDRKGREIEVWSRHGRNVVSRVRLKRDVDRYQFDQQGDKSLRLVETGNRVQVGEAGKPHSKFKPTRVNFESRYSGHTLTNYAKR